MASFLNATIVLQLIAFLALPCTGLRFGYSMILEKYNYTDASKYCNSLGYDGLAVVNTPEEYNYIMKITEHYRSTNRDDFYFGLRYDLATSILAWDDGKIPLSDEPIRRVLGDRNYRARLRFNDGLFRLGEGESLKKFFCGNYNRQPKEVKGKTYTGHEPSKVASSLSTGSVSSYLKCISVCGRDYRCRIAVFNVDRLTCVTFGHDSSTSLTKNSLTTTFVRNTFDVPP